jgi:hypothetical protein
MIVLRHHDIDMVLLRKVLLVLPASLPLCIAFTFGRRSAGSACKCISACIFVHGTALLHCVDVLQPLKCEVIMLLIQAKTAFASDKGLHLSPHSPNMGQAVEKPVLWICVSDGSACHLETGVCRPSQEYHTRQVSLRNSV